MYSKPKTQRKSTAIICDFDCKICHKDFAEMEKNSSCKVLRCGHVFCNTCITCWNQKSGSQGVNCPSCRQRCGKFGLVVAHYDAFGDIGTFRTWVKNAKLLWERDTGNSKRIVLIRSLLCGLQVGVLAQCYRYNSSRRCQVPLAVKKGICSLGIHEGFLPLSVLESHCFTTNYSTTVRTL